MKVITSPLSPSLFHFNAVAPSLLHTMPFNLSSTGPIRHCANKAFSSPFAAAPRRAAQHPASGRAAAAGAYLLHPVDTWLLHVCTTYRPILHRVQLGRGDDQDESSALRPSRLYSRVRPGKKSTAGKKVHRYLTYLNSHQVMWYHFLHQGKNLCQNPFSH